MNAPPKIKMEPKKWGFVNIYPFPRGYCQVLYWFSRVYMDGLMEDFWYYCCSLEVSKAVCGFLLLYQLYHVNRKGIQVFLPHSRGICFIFSNHLRSKSKLKIIPSRERRIQLIDGIQCKKSYSLHIMQYQKKKHFEINHKIKLCIYGHTVIRPYTPVPMDAGLACFGGSATGVLEDLVTCRQDWWTSTKARNRGH